MYLPKESNYDLSLNTEQISNKDILVIAVKLGLTGNQLIKLYLLLGLEDHDIENASRNAETQDVQLRAVKVLKHWREIKGKDATRSAILTSMEDCSELTKARQTLIGEHKWSSIVMSKTGRSRYFL